MKTLVEALSYLLSVTSPRADILHMFVATMEAIFDIVGAP
jgi:hypothetical protein